jgi:hypothetical protein
MAGLSGDSPDGQLDDTNSRFRSSGVTRDKSPATSGTCKYISINTRWPGPETIRLEEHAQRALSEQGCQIFLVQHTKTEKYTKLQQNIPKIYPKYTKLPQNLPNCHKIYQITTKYTKWP